MNHLTSRHSWLGLGAALAVGCSNGASDNTPAPQQDSAVAPQDAAASEAASEAASDSTTVPEPEAGVDAAPDAPTVADAGSDSGELDAGSDAPTEASGEDGSGDAGDDAGEDAMGPVVCFDGGKPPSDWPTVYADLFGPGPDGGMESTGHCGNSDCHGAPGGNGGLHIAPWTAAATYKAFTTQKTGYGVLVSLKPGPASKAILGNPSLSPLAWYGDGGIMPEDDAVTDPCSAAEVTAWLNAGGKNK
jgi:hypothetical protein